MRPPEAFLYAPQFIPELLLILAECVKIKIN